MMIRWSIWRDKKTVAALESDRRAEGAPGRLDHSQSRRLYWAKEERCIV